MLDKVLSHCRQDGDNLFGDVSKDNDAKLMIAKTVSFGATRCGREQRGDKCARGGC